MIPAELLYRRFRLNAGNAWQSRIHTPLHFISSDITSFPQQPFGCRITSSSTYSIQMLSENQMLLRPHARAKAGCCCTHHHARSTSCLSRDASSSKSRRYGFASNAYSGGWIISKFCYLSWTKKGLIPKSGKVVLCLNSYRAINADRSCPV
jgi:hypothetical protein